MRHFLAVFGLLVATPSLADVIAYSTPTGVTGDQSYAESVGMDFSAKTAVTVTQLGLFSSTGSGFAGNDTVTLFDTQTAAILAQLTFGPSSAGTQATGTADFFKTLANPVTLVAGHTYSIAALYGNGTDLLSNAGRSDGVSPTLTGGSYITYVGDGRYGGVTPNDLPLTPDTGPAARYSAASFAFIPASFTPAAVPAPGMLAGFGLAAMLVARRRRS